MDRERLDGSLRGALGGVVGLIAMRLFFEALGQLRSSDGAPGEAPEGPIERTDALDDIALTGIESREEEPATETAGRVLHEAVAGEEPGEDRRATLGQAVHWGYGILMGGAYGASRLDAEAPDLAGGLGYGAALWALGDELLVPLLGLSDGPTANDWTEHARGLGAHLLFGVATASATQALKRVM